MKRVSTENSRPAEDWEVWSEYLNRPDKQDDELLKYFPAWDRGWVSVTIPPVTTHMHVETMSEETHHIFGGRMGRWDREWNMVRVCKLVHRWCERYKTDGRILALHHKLLKNEWDEADAFKCLGMYPLGWASCQTPEHAWVVPYWEAIRKASAA